MLLTVTTDYGTEPFAVQNPGRQWTVGSRLVEIESRARGADRTSPSLRAVRGRFGGQVFVDVDRPSGDPARRGAEPALCWPRSMVILGCGGAGGGYRGKEKVAVWVLPLVSWRVNFWQVPWSVVGVCHW